MKSMTTASFWKCYSRLPEHIQELARKNYGYFMINPDHPGLNFKNIHHKSRAFWSVRIGDDYRAVGARNGENITWLWIGPHKEFDQLFG